VAARVRSSSQASCVGRTVLAVGAE
jgi:hypothetical protein